MAQRVRKAIIPAAGLGTRFLPATKAIAKEMLPIVDVPTIQLVIEEAVRAGIEEVILVTGRGKGSIEDHFDVSYELEHTLRSRGKLDLLAQVERVSKMVRLVSVRQKEPLGLGHAVLCARQAAGDEPVAVMLGDDLFDTGGPERRPAIGQLIDAFERCAPAGVISLLEVAVGQEHLYGVVKAEAPNEHGLLRLLDMVEKPAPGTAPSRLAIVGRYVLPAEIWPILEHTKPGKGGEIQITDALLELTQRGTGCYGLTIAGERHDAGDKVGYLRACLSYALQRPELRSELLPVLRGLMARYS